MQDLANLLAVSEPDYRTNIKTEIIYRILITKIRGDAVRLRVEEGIYIYMGYRLERRELLRML